MSLSGDELFAAGRFDEAMAAYRQILAKDPADAAARMGLDAILERARTEQPNALLRELLLQAYADDGANWEAVGWGAANQLLVGWPQDNDLAVLAADPLLREFLRKSLNRDAALERRLIALRRAVADRRNILVCGGTSSGKTTLTNALLAEVAACNERVILIEDTRELQCAAPNLVAMRTKDGVATLSDLVRSSLRLRPDRIPVGEVRGSEALDLLKAWGTGHPGGIGTIHAGSGIGALRRLEQLIQEAVITVPRALIAETIDLVAVLAGRGSSRRLVELARVDGLGPDGDYAITHLITLATTPKGNPS